MNKPQIRVEQQSQVLSATNWLASMLEKGLQSGAIIVQLSRPKRSDEQNRHLWPLLTCFSKQIEYGGKLRSKEEWKVILISAYKFDPQGIVIGINGEVVNLNYSTSELNKAQFSEFIELIYAEGTERGVTWSNPALEVYDEWKQ